MKFSTLVAVLVGTVLGFTSLLFADNTSMRCGNDLVSIGDTMYKIRRACGEPDYEKNVGEKKSYRLYKEKRVEVEEIAYITEWVYEKRQGEYILTFEGSRLVQKEYSR